MSKTCIVVLMHGMTDDNYYGIPNLHLTRRAMGLGIEKKYPIIAQFEITENLYALEYTSTYHALPFSGYLSTRDALKKVKDVMTAEGYEDAIFIVHQAQLANVWMVAKKLGIKENIYRPQFKRPIGYAKKSQLWWTRNAVFFSLYQFIESCMYWQNGDINLFCESV